MPKRASAPHEGNGEDGPRKRGGAQAEDHDMMDVDDARDKEMGEFEDEFEDEYDDDEILEAGVDGRPDAEREAEEKGGSSLVRSTRGGSAGGVARASI
jgi:ribosome assembly protein RRB1